MELSFIEYIKYKKQANFCVGKIAGEELAKAKKYQNFMKFLDLSYEDRNKYYKEGAFSWAYKRIDRVQLENGEVKVLYDRKGMGEIWKYVYYNPLSIVSSVGRLWQIKFIVSCCQVINHFIEWFSPKKLNELIGLQQSHPASTNGQQQRLRSVSTSALIMSSLKKETQKDDKSKSASSTNAHSGNKRRWSIASLRNMWWVEDYVESDIGNAASRVRAASI